MSSRGALQIGILLCGCFSAFAQTSDSPATPGDQPAVAPDTGKEPVDVRDPIWYPDDTERLKPLAYKLGANIFLDQKDIWTSPFHMHKKDLPLWFAFGGATAALIATDKHTSTVFENSPGQISWGNNISNIGASYTVLPLVAGFYGYGVWRDNAKAREVGVLGAESLLDGLLVMEALKLATGRNRPDATHEPGHFFEGGDSFPSGHTIESWAVASVIGQEYGHTKVVPIVAYSLATVVSLSRYAAQRHYASDIVSGAAIGWFIGRYVYKTHMDHAIHHHQRVPQIVPQFNPAIRQYGIALQFGK
jgi:membrane-associated phospholipid phosphatase